MIVQSPVAGRLFSTTLPAGDAQVGCVIVPGTGAAGRALTVSVNVAEAAAQGVPRGLLVVTVMITVLPASAAVGVYVKLNGDAEADAGVTVPPPFSEIVTLVALPPKVFPVTVTAVIPQVLPEFDPRVRSGGLTQPQLTEKSSPAVVQPDELRTVIVWLPFATSLKMLLVCQTPLLRRYSYPAPVGLVTVITAWLKPPSQLTVCTGAAGTGRGALTVIDTEAGDVHPAALVTV